MKNTLTQIDDNGNEINGTDISQQIEDVIGVDTLLKMVPDEEGLIISELFQSSVYDFCYSCRKDR